jgi:TolA-binding protein
VVVRQARLLRYQRKYVEDLEARRRGPSGFTSSRGRPMHHDREEPDLTKTGREASGGEQRSVSNGDAPRAEVLMAAASAGDVHGMDPHVPTHAEPHARLAPQREAPVAAKSHGSGIGVVLLAVLLSVPCGALGAWAYLTYGHSAEAAAKAAPVAEAPASPERVVPAVPPASAEDVKQVSKQMEALADRFDHLQERFAAIPRPEPPPDMTELKAQMENLQRDDATFCALPARIGALSDRLSELERSVAALRAASTPTDAQVKKTSAPTRAALTVPAAVTSNVSLVEDLALSDGISLFKRGRYADALALFGKLEEALPADARVWYFAALSNALATSDWRGETERLVRKGLEQERAGAIGTARINAAFTDLTAATGRDWLASQRKRLPNK